MKIKLTYLAERCSPFKLLVRNIRFVINLSILSECVSYISSVWISLRLLVHGSARTSGSHCSANVPSSHSYHFLHRVAPHLSEKVLLFVFIVFYCCDILVNLVCETFKRNCGEQHCGTVCARDGTQPVCFYHRKKRESIKANANGVAQKSII